MTPPAFGHLPSFAGEEKSTIAILHLAPRAGEIERNKRVIEEAVLRASAMGAKFIVTPELVASGYGFRDLIGTDWIARDQAALFDWAGALAHRASTFLLLGAPEAQTGDAKLFNSMILFAPDGSRLGHHRKINVLKVGSESWSMPGDRATVLAVAGIGRVGLFVCADMYSQRLVEETAAQGIDLLVSSAAWAPGKHGPNGEWERASRSTKRPVLVCNRTGFDVLDFGAAQSIVAADGSIVYCHTSADPACVLVDWDSRAHALTNWRAVAAEE
jgi:predicted amidohydrolase